MPATSLPPAKKRPTASTPKRRKTSAEVRAVSTHPQSPHLRPTKAPKLSKFSDEFSVLTETWRPSSISHRDAEKARIRSFIEEGIKNNGSETSLYITGLPGLGKTASVFEIMQLYSTNPRITTLYINALELMSTSTFYKQLWSKITGRVCLNNEACKRLAMYFRSRSLGGAASRQALAATLGADTSQSGRGSKEDKARSVEASLKKTKILIIDEIDYLITKKQEILYNIFDWMHTKNSHLIVISIANTLDFPSKLFPKIQSRMGHNLLVFKPYSSTEIASILNERLGNSAIFSKDALIFVAKKVASFSSDIRKSLHIVRNALKLYIKAADFTRPIDIATINRVFESESQKPLIVYIEKSPPIFRYLLTAVLMERVVKNASVFEGEALFERVNAILKGVQEERVAFAQFMVMVDLARDMGLLKRVFDNLKRMRVEIATDPEEMAFALRNDDVFNRFGPVTMFNKNE